MNQLITLDHFHTEGRQFHIYMPDSSSIASEPHFHDYFQMLYVISGEIRHEHANRALSLCAGDAFIIPPMFTHRLEFVSAKTEVYSLAFSPDIFHSGFSQSSIYRFLSGLETKRNGQEDVHLRIRLDGPQQEIFAMLMECLMKEQSSCPDGLYTAAPSLISSALYVLAQSYNKNSARNPDDQKRNSNFAVSDCVRYIDNHYMENISMQKLSREFAVSRSLLCPLFKQYTGLPIHRYIRNRRILAAEAMIRKNTAIPLSEVAVAVGYPESSTFFRNFTEVVGLSPSRYRRAYQRPD